MRPAGWTALLAALAAASPLAAESREARKKKRAMKDTEVAAAWVYDDLDAAVKAAREQSKPIFLVFR